MGMGKVGVGREWGKRKSNGAGGLGQVASANENGDGERGMGMNGDGKREMRMGMNGDGKGGMGTTDGSE